MLRFVPMALAAAVISFALAAPASAQLTTGHAQPHYSLDVPALRLQVQVTNQASYEQQPVYQSQPAYAASTHPDWGLVVTGSILLGVGYLTSIILGAVLDNAILYIPVLGGLIHAAIYSAYAIDVVVGLAISAAQIVGVILLIIGLVANIPDEPQQASLAPRLVDGPGDAGVALRWVF
jgi:hypothetical protein